MIDGPIVLYEATVKDDWIDHNQHMNTLAFHLVHGEALEHFLAYIGCDSDYRASGCSIFNAESRFKYLASADSGDKLQVSQQILGLWQKRFLLFQKMKDMRTGRSVSIAEYMLVHVDTSMSKAVPMPGRLNMPLRAICNAQSVLPAPEAAGEIFGISYAAPQ